jgi:hypothetical protein
VLFLGSVLVLWVLRLNLSVAYAAGGSLVGGLETSRSYVSYVAFAGGESASLDSLIITGWPKVRVNITGAERARAQMACIIIWAHGMFLFLSFLLLLTNIHFFLI